MPDEVLSPSFGQATLTDCDREPIHIPGSIQPHGALLAVDPESHRVLQWAGDLQELLGIGTVDPNGMTLRDLLGPEAAGRMEDAIRRGGPRPVPLKNYEVEIETATGMVDAIVHPDGPVLIVEFERAVRGAGGMQSALFVVQKMLAEVNRAKTLADYHQACAEQIRDLTGFARVMVYRFLEDGSGTVVAEAKADQLESYLGLHYPETDIPKQARELYRRNWLRCIPDVDYTPRPLSPEINPLTGAPLDLSHSVFRSVSPLHLRYLKNMGVAASMSLSIVNRDELWGLIACHHDAPHYLACETRAACEVFAQVFSLQLESRENAESYEYSLQQRSVHQQLVTRLAQEESLSDGLIRHRPNLLDLIQADGVVVFVDGEYSEIGHTPGQAGVQSLLRRLDTREDGVFATDSLRESFPDLAASCGEIAGVLALSVSRSPRDYILWFRREVVETVTWAGNPAKAVEVVDGTETLTPRASFAAWRETVRGRSRPWKPNEIESVEALRLSILEVVLRRIDQVARERAEAQERQALLVAELDHRVKNTIANIQSLMRHTRRSHGTLDGYVESLEKRIKAMAYAHNLLSQSRWHGAELKALLEDELRPHQTRDGAITIEGPPVELKPRAALALSMVFHELTTNAAKYGALSAESGRVVVQWREEADRLHLVWRERGGPPVDPPSRKGFGRTVIERSLSFELEGEVSLRFERAGVECDLSVPIDLVHRATHGNRQAGEDDGPRKDAPGKAVRLLLVEDSMITALDVAQTLEDRGFEVLGPTGRVSGAMSILDEEKVDVAVLDVNLGREDSFPIADRLVREGTPFVFLTGYDAASVLPSRLSDRTCLGKPFSDEELVRAITRLTENT
jgi:light-regulated signal transduction histidine kinase (bacteriophytochrome)